MKNSLTSVFAIVVSLLLWGCGSGTTTDSSATSDDGRIITGTIESISESSLSKDVAGNTMCIGEVCSITAYDSDGGQTSGEIEPEENRFRIRVRNGNWMFGFIDGNGNRLGYLELNGITALTIEDGDDVEIGSVKLLGEQFFTEEDIADLGNNGIYSYHAQDKNRDGIPLGFDDSEYAISSDSFDVLFVRPYDGQLHVAPCRPIKIVFTSAPDETTVNADTISVTTSDGNKIDGSLSIWEDAEYNEYEITFSPTGGYTMGETVTLTILSGENGVLSKEGEPLASNIETSFTIRDFGNSSQTCHDPDAELHQTRTQEREQTRNGENDQQNGGKNKNQNSD